LNVNEIITTMKESQIIIKDLSIGITDGKMIIKCKYKHMTSTADNAEGMYEATMHFDKSPPIVAQTVLPVVQLVEDAVRSHIAGKIGD